MMSNYLEKVAQIAANGTSEDLDFNIFQGRMHPEHPSNVITIISLQQSDFHLDPPLTRFTSGSSSSSFPEPSPPRKRRLWDNPSPETEKQGAD